MIISRIPARLLQYRSVVHGAIFRLEYLRHLDPKYRRNKISGGSAINIWTFRFLPMLVNIEKAIALFSDTVSYLVMIVKAHSYLPYVNHIKRPMMYNDRTVNDR